MEIIKFIINVFGIFILYLIIDYDRDIPIVSLSTLKGWIIILLTMIGISLATV